MNACLHVSVQGGPRGRAEEGGSVGTRVMRDLSRKIRALAVRHDARPDGCPAFQAASEAWNATHQGFAPRIACEQSPHAMPPLERLPLHYHTAVRVTGTGSVKVLLLHALTGGPDAADGGRTKGWWAPLFKDGAPLAFDRCTVWTPNLLGSCYGSSTRDALPPGTRLTARLQAEVLAEWIQREGLSFDLCIGGSLGGMVALELALLLPDLFREVAVIGCGARTDAWLHGKVLIQRAILENTHLPDAEAIALARHAAMLDFRTPDSLNARFAEENSIQAWLHFHGRALAERFTRSAYLSMLDAMDSHDVGRDRGGIHQALAGFKARLHVLGIDSDLLFVPSLVRELASAAEQAGCLGSLRWIESPHGHDAFLMEWDQVIRWTEDILREVRA